MSHAIAAARSQTTAAGKSMRKTRIQSIGPSVVPGASMQQALNPMSARCSAATTVATVLSRFPEGMRTARSGPVTGRVGADGRAIFRAVSIGAGIPALHERDGRCYVVPRRAAPGLAVRAASRSAVISSSLARADVRLRVVGAGR